MSLFSSIQLASNSLRATQIGLQVVGQNIANANTPGYIREEVNFVPAPTQRVGGLLLGLGVEVKGVVQKIDQFLEQRLRGATSDRASSETQEQTYSELEKLIGELNKTDLSTSLTGFFSSINEVANHPEGVEERRAAVGKGRTLTEDINRLASRTGQIRNDLNKRVLNMADDINRLTDQIGKLNVRIAETEGGDVSQSDAVGLRDQRNVALSDLSKLIDIRVQEQSSGAVAVFVGGDFLVYNGTVRQVKVELTTDRGLNVGNLRLADSDAPLLADSGELSGLIKSRDDILGGYLDNLDSFAKTLAFEFNKIYSSGQGLKGYTELTSERSVDSAAHALDAAGLPFTPVNGSFQIQVYNKDTKLTRTADISVDLNGLDQDTSLTSLIAQLNAVSGVAASITPERKLKVVSTGAHQEIAFANDTSGVLAALGLNTFFSGTTALDLGISSPLAADHAKFAASGGGIGADPQNALALTSFMQRPLDSQNGDSLAVLYDRLTGEVTQGSTVARSVANGFRVFEQNLQGQSLSTSGVSLDEEAVKMIQFQRSYQVSAKYIATLSELLDLLVKL